MREPSMKKLIVLSESLGCSVDYLLGLTPDMQRASLVVGADTSSISSKSSEPVRTSAAVSGKRGQLADMLSELMDSDIELLTHIASFLTERKEKGLKKLMSAIGNRSSSKRNPEDDFFETFADDDDFDDYDDDNDFDDDYEDLKDYIFDDE
jgi:hypothetical protein